MTPSVPTRMKAAVVDHFGGPEVLHTETLPVPKPGAHEILLRVDTAGIGVWDPWVRQGGFDDGSTRFPYVMGNDGAGVVVAVGPKVRRLHVGDRAYGYRMEGGFYAEYAKLEESRAAQIPKGVDLEEAGALGADGITALRGLDDQLRLRSGQSLVIIGASGGIGHMAVQLAKRIGARVLAVASRSDGVKLVKKLGADVAIDGRREDVAKAARKFAPEGLEAALVLAGGDDVNEALGAVKEEGRPNRLPERGRARAQGAEGRQAARVRRHAQRRGVRPSQSIDRRRAVPRRAGEGLRARRSRPGAPGHWKAPPG